MILAYRVHRQTDGVHLTLTYSSKEIRVLSPLAQSTISYAFVAYVSLYVFLSVIFATFHHGSIIHQRGIRNALLHQRESLNEAAKCIKFIWHTRELLTDVFIKGMTAHMSIAMKSVLRSHSYFKKLSSCSLGICLIASRILDTAHPKNSQLLMISTLGAILSTFIVDNWNSSKEVKVLSPLTQSTISFAFVTYVFLSLIFATLYHGSTIHQLGIRNALLYQKESLKGTAKCIKYIWHTRELLTDVFIEGIAAHISIAMKSMRRAIRRLQ